MAHSTGPPVGGHAGKVFTSPLAMAGPSRREGPTSNGMQDRSGEKVREDWEEWHFLPGGIPLAGVRQSGRTNRARSPPTAVPI